MARTYKLEHFAKGTGATVVPEEGSSEPAAERPLNTVRVPAAPRKPRKHEPRSSRTPLPAGHVRKIATGEIGRLQAVDAKAGTATVLWLKQGRASTVPLAAITRR
jgi:hypothetical protein